ncbi:hypothetical protein V2J09_014758 [Rumex salicifolius]
MAWTSRTVVALLAALVLLQVQLSMQLPYNHPMRRAVERVNRKQGPFMGLLMTFPKEETVLVESGFFKPSPYVPSIQIAGKIFNIGTVKGVPTIYVMTGEQITNAAMTTQLLYATFDVVGVVHYGIAGAVNASLNIGDVVIPDYVAYANSWHWFNNVTEEKGKVTMEIGKYNIPKPGGNLLGEISFDNVEVFTNKVGNEERDNYTFWIQTDPNWLKLSQKLEHVKLNTCLKNGTSEVCVTKQPKSHYGQKGATTNIVLENVSFRDLLFRGFNFTFADEETAPIVHTSVSNNKPCVVFRAICDFSGGNTDNTTTPSSTLNVEYLAAYNGLKLAVEFIGLFKSHGKLNSKI